MATMRTIQLFGDVSGYILEVVVTTSSPLDTARELARFHAVRLSEPVEARVITSRGNYLYGVRHVPGVTMV